MTTTEPPAVLAVDLGKTSCRARVTRGDTVVAEMTGAGAPGLADHNGAALSFAAIVGTLERLDAQLDTSAPSAIARIGIGAAGVEAGRKAAAQLITLVRGVRPVPVAVINDALAAHAGAFAGGHGAILIAGTGAIVFAVTEAGVLTQIDGWGPWLGDEGSGQWIGRHGLMSVLRAHDGRGPSTMLTEDAVALAGAVEKFPLWVSETGAAARQLGRFAPAVIARAERGDAVAVGIVAEAARLLAQTCAASRNAAVCVTGGLSAQPYFAGRVRDALDAVGVRAIAARGDALDGSALIALRQDLPYEGRIIRG